MFLLSFFADLVDKKSFFGVTSEPLAVLFFGVALFAITGGLRFFLNRQDKSAEKMLGKIKAIVINNN